MGCDERSDKEPREKMPHVDTKCEAAVLLWVTRLERDKDFLERVCRRCVKCMVPGARDSDIAGAFHFRDLNKAVSMTLPLSNPY